VLALQRPWRDGTRALVFSPLPARAAEAGFDEHLVKPVDQHRLFAALGPRPTG
jgi:hypothetical protein